MIEDRNGNEIYAFDTRFENQEENMNEFNKKNKLIKENFKKGIKKNINVSNLQEENETYTWLVSILLFITIFNLLVGNIGQFLSGIITTCIILVLINNVRFYHSEEIDYYLYNMIILSKKILFKNKLLKTIYNNANHILKYSILLSFLNNLIFSQIPFLKFISMLLNTANPYGIVLGLILCFVNEDNISINRNSNIFYIFQLISLFLDGFLKYFICGNKGVFINFNIVISTFIIMFISQYIKKCKFDFIRESIKEN